MSDVVLFNHLKVRRAEKGWTQAQLAEAVGVTRKTINTVENRVFVPSALLALKIAAVLGISVEDAFYLDEAHTTRAPTVGG